MCLSTMIRWLQSLSFGVGIDLRLYGYWEIHCENITYADYILISLLYDITLYHKSKLHMISVSARFLSRIICLWKCLFLLLVYIMILLHRLYWLLSCNTQFILCTNSYPGVHWSGGRAFRATACTILYISWKLSSIWTD